MVGRQCAPAVANSIDYIGQRSRGQELKPVFRSDGFCFIRPFACWAASVEHRDFSDHRIENPARRTDDYLTTYFRTRAHKAMRRSARHEHRIAGGEFEQLAVQAKAEVPFADDESLVVVWGPGIATARFGGFHGLPAGIRIPAPDRCGLEVLCH